MVVWIKTNCPAEKGFGFVLEAVFLFGEELWPIPECDFPLFDLKQLEEERESVKENPLTSAGAAVTPSQSLPPWMTLGTSPDVPFQTSLGGFPAGSSAWIHQWIPPFPWRLLQLPGLLKSWGFHVKISDGHLRFIVMWDCTTYMFL